MSTPKKHILVLAYPAYGHLIPTVELARRISRHHRVTVALSRERANLLPTKNHFHPQPDEDIHVFGIEDGVPGDVFPANFGQVIRQQVEPSVRQLILEVDYNGDKECKGKVAMPAVDWIVADNFFAPILSACTERGIPYYGFHTTAVRLLRYMMLVDENVQLIKVVGPPPFPHIPARGQRVPSIPEGIFHIFRHMNKATVASRGTIQNGFRAMQTDDIALLRDDTDFRDKPLFCVGPLLPVETAPAGDDPVVRWLDRQPPRSVVYVSFGSSIGPNDDQVAEIAKALTGLGRPFVWSLRDPQRRLLPEVMRERVEKQFDGEGCGFVVANWVPQMAVLNHPATGVFVSHCGWNSSMEALSAGVPMVAWPMFADQKSTSQWFVEHGVAVMLSEEGKMGKLVQAQNISAAIQTVAGWGEGTQVNAENKYQLAAQRCKNEIAAALGPTGSSTQEFMQLMEF